MQRMKRLLALLLLLFLFISPCYAMADQNEVGAPAVTGSMDDGAPEDQAAEAVAETVRIGRDIDLCQQIRDTYQAAKKLGRRSSYKGYCGAYVANQLLVLGINTSRLSANGNRTYDIYRNMSCTTGGYDVIAYGAREYSLSEALTAIMGRDPDACNILVGFEKGISKASKKYGHVLLIHGVRGGKIYFSDSCDRTIEGMRYREGEPIVCSLDAFLEQYGRYKLDGVVQFQKKEGLSSPLSVQLSMAEESNVISSENLATLG